MKLALEAPKKEPVVLLCLRDNRNGVMTLFTKTEGGMHLQDLVSFEIREDELVGRFHNISLRELSGMRTVLGTEKVAHRRIFRIAVGG